MSFQSSGEWGYEPLEEVGEAKTHSYRPIHVSKRSKFAVLGGGVLLSLVLLASMRSTTQLPAATELHSSQRPLYPVEEDLQGSNVVIHISDTHVDPFYDPAETLKAGVCHTCKFSTEVFGQDRKCPNTVPTPDLQSQQEQGYAFGRYGCNPPHRLWHSLHQSLKTINPNPEVIVFTGDISPHGMPDDTEKVHKDSTVDDLCETKFIVTRQMIRDLKREFPTTKWAYTLGNNDHFPKNTYWQPYITKYGEMLRETGFFTNEQADMFVKYGSQYIDVDNIRYICLDFTLFTPGGETSWSTDDANPFPVRRRVVDWFRESLKDAKEKGLKVWIVGHQPLATAKGKDELTIDEVHFELLKEVMTMYSGIIELGLFGHRNLAGLNEVFSSHYLPLFPAITAPGVSPRGKNQPSYHVMYVDPNTGKLLDFEQWVFNLMDQNQKVKNMTDTTYAGEWKQHSRDMYSWRALSGEKDYTVDSLKRMLDRIPENSHDFFAIQTWAKAGYIGVETPENYRCKGMFDTADKMMYCLFPNQDERCWDSSWIM